MCDFLRTIEWLNLVQTLAVIFMAYIAYMALHTWKHQAKANRQTSFLDELTDAVHEYIQSLSRPIEFLKLIYIGFDSYRDLPTNIDHKHSHVIAYITARGSDEAEKMWEYLSSSNALVARVQALVARGQVYGFNEYTKCQKSVDMLLWQHQRLQVVASIIGSPTLNWEHPEVVKGIENMLSVQPTDIQDHLKRENIVFLEFVRNNYKSIYKDT